MHGDSNTLWQVLAGFVLFVLLILLVAAVRACAVDARRRGKSAFLVTFVIIIFFPVGLIAWILFRPAPLGERQRQPGFQLKPQTFR